MKNSFRKTSSILVFAIALIVLSSVQVFAATFFVDNNTPGTGVCTQPAGSLGPFATIMAAENVSANGDTILVCPGTYPESVVLTKAFQVVQGISDDVGSRVRITGAGNTDAFIVQIRASDVLFQNFTIDGASQTGAAEFYGIHITSASPGTGITGVIVQNNTILNITSTTDPTVPIGSGIVVERGGGTATQILNNTILNYQRNGIWLNNTGSSAGSSVNAIVQGNYAGGQGLSTRGNGQTGIRAQNGARGDINNNRISENQRTGGCTGIDTCGQGIVANASSTPLTIRNNNISKINIGVTLQDVSSSSVTRNQIFNNTNAGIALVGSTPALGSNFNDISLNRLFSSSSAAIAVTQASTANSIATNVIEDAPFGVGNTGVSTSISGNTFFSVDFHVFP